MESSNVAVKDAELNPRTTTYEFLGPPGALFIISIVPAVMYALCFGCSEAAGCRPNLPAIPRQIAASLSDPGWWKGLWDTEATLIYFAWYIFCVVAWAILPGDRVEGTTLRTGEKKTYKINAFSTFLLSLALTAGIIYGYGPQSFTFLYERWVGFVTASILLAFVQATYCYGASFRPGKLLALGGNSGNCVYDFFIGRELNPSIGSLDLKYFNELRPGLILWVLVNTSMVCEQAVRRGGLDKVTDSMWLAPLFTTMDITTDGFGFMLAIAIAWEPFTYSLQARYLAYKHIELGPGWVTAILLTNLTGYYIFRDANGEKNGFRNGKNPKNLQYLTTASGSKLLTSGWWGLCQHPNYLGDLLMALAWSLPTGFNTPITYFYVCFFAVLLAHRQRRDDEKCHKKYGKDWDKYKKLVPYRIIPYIY
ncbi:Delta(14)-sterol reductase [Hypsizygus marmoreus]|uniref:Delta(14)-sterol reductase n=1 Tax=Hypsizygus marmoreus TaxID=39966 RepID=A0A369K266_HYPMA|nr:Delta(14)-sterol reductase [Hypsizygus marmoreus]